MEDINVRFKQLRLTCGKTQTEFGKILGLGTSGISDIEGGRRKVTKQHLIMLSNWKDKDVNIDWLQTGEGEMFKKIPEKEEVAKYVSGLLEDMEDPFYSVIIEIMRTFSELSPKSQEALRDFAAKLRKNLESKKEG